MYEAKVEESEKRPAATRSQTQDTWLEPPVLCHWATTTGQPPALTILYMYCTGGTEIPQSYTWQPLFTSILAATQYVPSELC